MWVFVTPSEQVQEFDGWVVTRQVLYLPEPVVFDRAQRRSVKRFPFPYLL